LVPGFDKALIKALLRYVNSAKKETLQGSGLWHKNPPLDGVGIIRKKSSQRQTEL